MKHVSFPNCLLIDGDNVQLQHTEAVIRFCQRYGALPIINAYGDWQQPPLSAHCKALTALGVTLVQQKRVCKNAADFRLAMDVAVMLEKRAAATYFLFTNDGHFAAVCDHIRQAGSTVVVIGGNNKISRHLHALGIKVVNVESIVKGLAKP